MHRCFVLVVLVASLVALNGCGKPQNVVCPQSPDASLPDGWQTSMIHARVPKADGLTVFDGHPEELASLVPDNEPAEAGEMHFWTFPVHKERQIWVECTYQNKAVRLIRALPDGIVKCAVIEPHGLSCE